MLAVKVAEREVQDDTYTCPECGDEFDDDDWILYQDLVTFDDFGEFASALMGKLGIQLYSVRDDEYGGSVYYENVTLEIPATTVRISELGYTQTYWECGSGCWMSTDDYSTPEDSDRDSNIWQDWQCGNCKTIYEGKDYDDNDEAARLARECCA